MMTRGRRGEKNGHPITDCMPLLSLLSAPSHQQVFHASNTIAIIKKPSPSSGRFFCCRLPTTGVRRSCKEKGKGEKRARSTFTTSSGISCCQKTHRLGPSLSHSVSPFPPCRQTESSPPTQRPCWLHPVSRDQRLGGER